MRFETVHNFNFMTEQTDNIFFPTMLILALTFAGCSNTSDKPIAVASTDSTKVLQVPPSFKKNTLDTVLTLGYKLDISNINIKNSSDRQIDILFNGVDGFLGGHKNMNVNFRTECMMCEPVQKFQGGLLFAKRLLLKSDQARFYPQDFNIPDSIDLVKCIGYYGERKKMNFRFEDGAGTMRYLIQSCNDADYDNVQLKYKSGSVTVDSIINATFFEFDLDTDGIKEQYLYGTRNCSQELVILRICKK